MKEKKCVLDETKICNDCGECSRCDLDPNKVCDNCMKCLKISDAEYGEILIDGVSKPDPELQKMLEKLLSQRESAGKKGS